jgi:hypothetical protein
LEWGIPAKTYELKSGEGKVCEYMREVSPDNITSVCIH